MQLDIFDVRGRRVRTLWDQETAEGPGQTSWDGRDNSGRMARSGMYLYLVRFGDRRLSGSLTLIK
jgi:flagellar hook assembly protein FlgD